MKNWPKSIANIELWRIGVAQWGAPARSEIEMDLCKSRRYKRLSEQLQSIFWATVQKLVCNSNCLCKWATVLTSNNMWLRGPVESILLWAVSSHWIPVWTVDEQPKQSPEDWCLHYCVVRIVGHNFVCMSNILAYVYQCVQWMGILSYAQESDVLILCYICVAFLQCVFSNVCTVDGHPDSDLDPQATSCLSHEP